MLGPPDASPAAGPQGGRSRGHPRRRGSARSAEARRHPLDRREAVRRGSEVVARRTTTRPSRALARPRRSIHMSLGPCPTPAHPRCARPVRTACIGEDLTKSAGTSWRLRGDPPTARNGEVRQSPSPGHVRRGRRAARSEPTARQRPRGRLRRPGLVPDMPPTTCLFKNVLETMSLATCSFEHAPKLTCAAPAARPCGGLPARSGGGSGASAPCGPRGSGGPRSRRGRW